MRIRKIEDSVASTKTIDTLPIGTILPFGSSTIPTGWLLCDGTAISRTTYKFLFDIIGTSFGTGDGSTTFNLPNMKGKTVVGMDSSQTEFDALGETGGEKTHKLTVNEMPKHTHGEAINSSGGARYPYTISGGGGTTKAGNWISGANTMLSYTGAQNLTDSTGGDEEHNNLQPYIVTNYIIKAERTVGLTGVVTNIPSASADDTYSCEYINKLQTYSTTEQIIGKWIDGKSIYRKVIAIGSVSGGGAITTDTGLNLSNVFILSINAIYITTANNIIGTNFANPLAANAMVGTRLNSAGKIFTIAGLDNPISSGYAIIEYVKQ